MSKKNKTSKCINIPIAVFLYRDKYNILNACLHIIHHSNNNMFNDIPVTNQA